MDLTMQQIKQAADSLLQKGEITNEEHSEVTKIASPITMTVTGATINDIIKGILSHSQQPGAAGILQKLKIPALIAGGTLATATVAKELLKPVIEHFQAQGTLEKVKQMPQLAGEDPTMVEQYFNVIKTFSPKAATNPLVAGALVNKMVEFGGVDHKLVQDLAALQAAMPMSFAVNKAIESGISGITAPVKA